MDAPKTMTRARVAALVVIAMTLLGLASPLLAAGTEPPSVPPGAAAGDLFLQPCDHPTEAGLSRADCGIVVVAEDAAAASPRLIALPVIRIRAASPDPAEPIFYLEGGPGQSNLDFPQASRYAENHDVVLVGYRGIDGSVRLDCPEVSSALGRSTDLLAESSLRAYGDGYRACAERLAAEGVDVTSYGMVQQIDDVEVVREALGYDRIDLLSQSAGTRTAMIYAWRHPDAIHRSVMFGVNPPGNLLWSPEATAQQVARYAELCREDPTCRARTDDLAASMARLGSDMPDRWLVFPIKRGNARVLSFTMMMQSTADPGISSAAGAFDVWLSAAEGDPAGLWLTSVLADLLVPDLFVWGQYASAASVDAEAARIYFSPSLAVGENLGRDATTFSWGGGHLADAWPPAREAATYRRVRTSQVPTLLIGGELDVSTPPQVAREELLPHLPNGQEVVLSGFAHSPNFWSAQPEAGTRLITTFFDTGEVDTSLYEPQEADFTPSVRGTTLAKQIVAGMVGLALLAVLSLGWTARRVRRRGGLAPGPAVLLRTLSPVVLGLGGWCLAALVVLVALPSVRPTNELLTILAIGAPVGLGIHYAAVRRDQPRRVRTRGLAAAVSGALLGGWLGYAVIALPLGLVTTMVGATAVANLAVIVSAMSWERSRVPADPPAATAVQVPTG